MMVTDKFSKRVMTILGRDTHTASDWKKNMVSELADGWGILKAIISDRDLKFTADMFKAIFKSLGTKLLTTTAYHPQSDRQSERTNQVVEIALRFFLIANLDKDWEEFLPLL